MIRGSFFFVVLGLILASAVWLADHPGRVAVDWQGYRIDTSASVLVVLVGFVAAIAAILYRSWGTLRRVPGQLVNAWLERRRRRGYASLSRGMVAVAAGDAVEARKHAKRADVLLEDPPLTLLLSAQAAQLAGDEDEAGRYFRRMLEKPETEFLGLRGLLIQAAKTGDTDKALDYARRAWKLRPNSEWVAAHFIDLLIGAALWTEADGVLDSAQRRKLITDVDGTRRRLVVGRGVASALASTEGKESAALKRARQDFDRNPGFVPAAVQYAVLLVGQGKNRKAVSAIEKAWAMTPHPELLAPYFSSKGADAALEKMKAAEKLASKNPDHTESHVAVAVQALEAELWGEARRHLTSITLGTGTPQARVCRLMAELEEREHGNMALAKDWLMRAGAADPDPAWVCNTCGHADAKWSPVCPHCGDFDALAWGVPSHTIPRLTNYSDEQR